MIVKGFLIYNKIIHGRKWPQDGSVSGQLINLILNEAQNPELFLFMQMPFLNLFIYKKIIYDTDTEHKLESCECFLTDLK